MNNELTALRVMIAKYALVHCANEIPQSYYETMIKTWHEMNRQGHDWSQSNAAAALLHLAVVEGIIHISQLTPRGYKAIDWAKNFTRNLEAVAA